MSPFLAGATPPASHHPHSRSWRKASISARVTVERAFPMSGAARKALDRRANCYSTRAAKGSLSARTEASGMNIHIRHITPRARSPIKPRSSSSSSNGRPIRNWWMPTRSRTRRWARSCTRRWRPCPSRSPLSTLPAATPARCAARSPAPRLTTITASICRSRRSELAAKNLAGVPFEVELDHRDFVTALTRRPEPADAAWCGLSIHHLDRGQARPPEGDPRLDQQVSDDLRADLGRRRNPRRLSGALRPREPSGLDLPHGRRVGADRPPRHHLRLSGDERDVGALGRERDSPERARNSATRPGSTASTATSVKSLFDA